MSDDYTFWYTGTWYFHMAMEIPVLPIELSMIDLISVKTDDFPSQTVVRGNPNRKHNWITCVISSRHPATAGVQIRGKSGAKPSLRHQPIQRPESSAVRMFFVGLCHVRIGHKTLVG